MDTRSYDPRIRGTSQSVTAWGTFEQRNVVGRPINDFVIFTATHPTLVKNFRINVSNWSNYYTTTNLFMWYVQVRKNSTATLLRIPLPVQLGIGSIGVSVASGTLTHEFIVAGWSGYEDSQRQEVFTSFERELNNGEQIVFSAQTMNTGADYAGTFFANFVIEQ